MEKEGFKWNQEGWVVGCLRETKHGGVGTYKSYCSDLKCDILRGRCPSNFWTVLLFKMGFASGHDYIKCSSLTL